MNTITIVYNISWEVTEEWMTDVDSLPSIDSKKVIEKLFYKSEDAVKYMNSIPNQSYPPDYIELLDNPYEYEFATGFYLVDEQYPIE